MPLRDHFRPPLSARRSWEGLHGGWPAMITRRLNERLPRHYVAEPRIRFGSSPEVDAADLEEDEVAAFEGPLAAWAPPEPSLAVATEPPAQDEYEVRVFEARSGRKLVATVELVSPSNKDRPEHRRAFVTKCAALLRERVCVAVVDIVTGRHADLFGEILGHLGAAAPPSTEGDAPLTAASCRYARRGDVWRLEAWAHPLAPGRPLPTLPLWLAEGFSVPLELEASYEETCRALRIPPA